MGNGVNYGTHFLVDENGNIIQTASLNKYTLHVGKTRKSSYPKNGNSIGIEVVGAY
ncbi:N-acetylmuramoyl-L-alanine amidase [Sphingobacterium alkalisoli]|uniref:N-acetylmuramoyl-L-alanine amidase n=1 Tax=Sphingobacterium alkalisoli TaxID=1874115 RepID=A0A4U0GXV5_9SPHI|nr:N-acetylmuramoyl-L-alanine amidase [Sphingobacterium alkalisoli]